MIGIENGLMSDPSRKVALLKHRVKGAYSSETYTGENHTMFHSIY